MPQLDVAASAKVGQDLESLERVPLHQPRPTSGWSVSDEALQHLWSIRDRGLVAKAKRTSEAGRELRAAGLTTALGALTADGATVARCIGAPVATFGVEARHAGRTSTWGYWADRETGVVQARASVAELLEVATAAGPAQDGPVRLELLPLDRAVGRLLAWTGLSPAWAVAEDEPLILPADVLDDRIDRPGPRSEPSPVDDWAMRRLWDRPAWTQISGWSATTGNGFRVVTAGDAGAFRRQPVVDRPDLVQLFPVPTGTVLQDVVAMFTERRVDV
ncbi:hypothetical protein [Frigoribacterium sp. VKM Ac-2530]|uniref:hypothetical protein n=1 Tax=Frigoribacterium sp. VKM Ac-2530 TaxID=2783822 RepID=UPI00188D830E|nr:hypothetical protein [Frigoribacterium sp. VKM Ac-2530]MBF4580541.1 hypothetical protein [Frigoribacterium sp. VKM Ac-2530]